VEETFPEPRLLPREPGQRALARIWIDFANTRLAPAFGKVLWGASPAEQEAGKSELKAALELIETEALAKLSSAGPYWFGAAPTLVDFAVYPWLERLPALTQQGGFELPRSLERLARFREALAARESVSAIKNPTEFYVERYRARKPSAPAGNATEPRAAAR
jgi:glutathione S-transferase